MNNSNVKPGDKDTSKGGVVAPMVNKKSKESDPVFLPDTHEELFPDTDSETDGTLSEQDPDFSDSEGDEVHPIDDDVLETLRRLKSQVAEHSKSIRDGIATMHNAMSQQREFLQV